MRFGFPAFFTLLFSALVTLLPASALAQKPVVLVTASDLDELFGDFSYMADALGFAQIGQMGTMMAGQFTEGIDTTKPIGIAVTVEEGEFNPLLMLPVKDLDTFLAGLEDQIGEPRKAGDGIMELAGPVPMYLKKKGGWAFVAQSADGLDKLPNDPMKLIGAVADTYDISIRGYIQNIPEEYREMAIAQIREGVEMQLDEDDEDAAAQKKMIENAIKQYEDMFKGVDRLTIGISINEDAQKMVVDTNITAVPGTKVAKQMEMLNNLKSRFGGFVMKDAAVTMHMMSKLLPEDREVAASNFDVMIPQLMEQIEENAQGDEVQIDATKKVVGTLMDALRDTIEAGEIDAGMSVLLNEEFAFVAGMGVADGSKVEEAIKAAAEAIESDDVEFKMSVDQHAGVRMHRMGIAVDSDDDKAQQMFGEELQITFGIADKSVYVAAGADSADYLRKAIDNSASAKGKSVLPMRMRISAAKIVDFAKQFDDDDTLAAVADELEKVGAEQGYVMMIAKPVAKGAQYRFEVREGVFKAIGRAIQASQGEAAAF